MVTARPLSALTPASAVLAPWCRAASSIAATTASNSPRPCAAACLSVAILLSRSVAPSNMFAVACFNAARRWAATEKTPSQNTAAARIDAVATGTSTRLTGRAAQCERAASARPFHRRVEITGERELDPPELSGGDETEAAHDITDLRRRAQ